MALTVVGQEALVKAEPAEKSGIKTSQKAKISCSCCVRFIVGLFVPKIIVAYTFLYERSVPLFMPYTPRGYVWCQYYTGGGYICQAQRAEKFHFFLNFYCIGRITGERVAGGEGRGKGKRRELHAATGPGFRARPEGIFASTVIA